MCEVQYAMHITTWIALVNKHDNTFTSEHFKQRLFKQVHIFAQCAIVSTQCGRGWSVTQANWQQYFTVVHCAKAALCLLKKRVSNTGITHVNRFCDTDAYTLFNSKNIEPIHDLMFIRVELTTIQPQAQTYVVGQQWNTIKLQLIYSKARKYSKTGTANTLLTV